MLFGEPVCVKGLCALLDINMKRVLRLLLCRLLCPACAVQLIKLKVRCGCAYGASKLKRLRPHVACGAAPVDMRRFNGGLMSDALSKQRASAESFLTHCYLYVAAQWQYSAGNSSVFVLLLVPYSPRPSRWPRRRESNMTRTLWLCAKRKQATWSLQLLAAGSDPLSDQS